MKAIIAAHSCVSFIMQYKVVLTFESWQENLKCDYLNENFYKPVKRL